MIDAAATSRWRSPSSRRWSASVFVGLRRCSSATTTPPSRTACRPCGAGLLVSIAGGLLVLAGLAWARAARTVSRRGRVRRLAAHRRLRRCPAVLHRRPALGHHLAVRRGADRAGRAFLADLPAQGAGLRPLLRAARSVRHRHAAGRVGRRARTVLRRVGDHRHLLGALHRLLPRARRAGAVVGARVRDLSPLGRRAADRHGHDASSCSGRRVSRRSPARPTLPASRPPCWRCCSCCRRWASRRSCPSRAGCRARWKGRRRRARSSTAPCRSTRVCSCCCGCGR